MNQKPLDIQAMGISSRTSACRAGVDSNTGPESTSSETSPIGTSQSGSFSAVLTSRSPFLPTRAPGCWT